MKPLVDLSLARAQLSALFRDGDTLKFVVLGPAGADGKGRVDNERRIVGLSSAVRPSVGGVLDWAAERNQQDFDVFVGANPVGRRVNDRGRMAYGATAAHVQRFACAQLDLDKDTVSAIGRLARDVKGGMLPTPAMVLRTSRAPNKYQMLWTLRSSDWGSPQDPQKAGAVFNVNRSMAQRYGGDPASCDVARLVRLAGFVNRKAVYRDRPVTVRSGLVTRLAGLPPVIEARPKDFDALARLLPQPVVGVRPAGVQPVAGAGCSRPFSTAGAVGSPSQSEADWAAVCSQLENGRSPDAVADSLAAFRERAGVTGAAPVKRKLYYYAVQTVAQAAQRLGVAAPTLTPAQALALDSAGDRPWKASPATRPVVTADSQPSRDRSRRRALGPPPIETIGTR